MPNMSLQKHPMPEQQPDIRATNFKEVALGYTREIAMEEADRCLHCKNAPCVKGCPADARYYDSYNYLYHKQELELGFTRRAEPELFF